MNELYPLKFKAVFKEKIWGGNRIRETFNLDYSPLPNCGEAWLISGVEGEQTVVSNGFLEGNELNELVEVYMTDLVGEKLYFQYKDKFPILIKLIDANDWLSVQVHPDDKLALKKHNTTGKTEMWYINKAEQNAQIICGFNREMDKAQFGNYLEKGRIKEIINLVQVKEDDVLYIPAGRVHALGPGILLTEIQQTSDITYRIYDWDRFDAKDNPRDLHIADAAEAIDFTMHYDYKTPFRRQPNKTVPLATSPYFTTNLLQINKKFERDYNIIDSFVIYVGQKGKVTIEYEKGTETFAPGEAVLIPSSITNLSLIPENEADILEIYIE